MQAHPGVHLEWHLNQQWELRYALVQGKFDYLVFQQAAHPFPPREETLRDAAKMVELAKACGTVPVATIPWAERRFPESQQERYDTFDLVGEQTGVTLSPVGYVFERVEREEKDIDLYFVDGSTPRPTAAMSSPPVPSTASLARASSACPIRASAMSGGPGQV